MTQEQTVLYMLQEGPKTTHEFCRHPGLAAEYRRAVSTLRRRGHQIVAKKIDRGNWSYILIVPEPVKKDLFV